MKHIRELQARLAGDDARGSTRGQIAFEYLKLGNRVEAVKWFLEAAKHAEWSELALVPLTWAKKAVSVDPDNAEAWAVYRKHWSRTGLPGEAPPVELTKE